MRRSEVVSMDNKVLVVDSNHINMELTLEILNTMGFTAEGTENGKEAIKKAEKETYDLILTEIMLLGVNGFEMRKIIKSKPVNKRVPIIAITAQAMKGDKERFLGAGFDDYISKPLDVLDFMKRMEKYKKGRNLVERRSENVSIRGVSDCGI